jgi:hypothetical protein
MWIDFHFYRKASESISITFPKAEKKIKISLSKEKKVSLQQPKRSQKPIPVTGEQARVQ